MVENARKGAVIKLEMQKNIAPSGFQRHLATEGQAGPVLHLPIGYRMKNRPDPPENRETLLKSASVAYGKDNL